MLIDLNRVAGLEGTRLDDGVVRVGAMTRQWALERAAAARAEGRLLAEALGFVGHPPIRARGTVGGSLAHADPAAELPAVLVCLGGEVVARSRAGERVIPAAGFFRDLLTTALGAEEILTEVRFRLPAPTAGWAVLEVARRHGDFALVGAVAVWDRDRARATHDVRLALFGVGPTPVRATAAEAALAAGEPTPRRIAEAAAAVVETLRPESDLHASSEYRRQVAGVLARRALTLALARSAGGSAA